MPLILRGSRPGYAWHYVCIIVLTYIKKLDPAGKLSKGLKASTALLSTAFYPIIFDLKQVLVAPANIKSLLK
jgi:hypothetical protein